MIAEAADELGLENLTLRAVADHLGVSIAALYHHVASKEDLLRIGAEVAAGKLPRPRFEGQHWSAWLLEWGLYNRDAFVDDPGLLTQYICGGITSEAIASSVASAVRELVDQGFTADEATAAHQLVSLAGVGAGPPGPPSGGRRRPRRNREAADRDRRNRRRPG
jgi:AcrR family transcriptional regulator